MNGRGAQGAPNVGGSAQRHCDGWRRWAPGLADICGYRRRWFRDDVQAGLSVAAYLIPQSMAYAALAGLSPVVGLWAAMPALLIYAILGSSRQLSIGPESTTALMTASALAVVVADGDPAKYIACAAALTLLVGLICCLAGVLRLGFLAGLLSRPVLVGYMTGIAIAMVVSQLYTFLGLPASRGDVLQQVRGFFTAVSDLHWPTALLGAVLLGVLIVVDRYLPQVPGPLLGVFAATAIVSIFALHQHGVDVIGEIHVGILSPGLPGLPLDTWRELLVPALGIAIVAFSDDVLTARGFAARAGEDIDANAELRALGVANLAVAIARGFPVSSSGSRTALGVAAGARTQVHSLVIVAVVFGVVTWGRGLVALIPSVALAALIVFAAIKLVDAAEFRRLARFRRSELLLAVVTALCVPVFGVLNGVLVAVVLSILELLRRIARAHDSVQGLVPGLAGMHDVDDYPEAELIPGLVVYRYDAPLCFANADDFHRRAMVAVDRSPTPVRWFVLNAEANVEVDITAMDALEKIRLECNRRGIVFAMARVKQDLREALRAAGMLDEIGSDHLFMTLPTAVAAYRRWCSAQGA
ncbi:SulP family inorganic anion transporter [Mycolicibacterium sp. P9-22]|uniref:SulP family inorganic anion transporter n=1 Tax=Mycolicibacterium sp. P9-22 TaxID=2024613 RepID=UPI0011EDA384|nr:sulfate permease [Mycolicibacterium sp. P9-22]KAA0118343.1 sulfate permease [Mycolicibacterium sp. P9-22]